MKKETLELEIEGRKLTALVPAILGLNVAREAPAPKYSSTKECFPLTQRVYPLLVDLFGGKSGGIKIEPEVTSHVKGTHDIVKIGEHSLNRWIMMFLSENGEITYSVRIFDLRADGRQTKVRSRGNAAYANMVADTLDTYRKKVKANFKIYQQDEGHPYVVVTTPRLKTLAAYKNREIYGIVFNPPMNFQNKINEGAVYLLARKRRR